MDSVDEAIARAVVEHQLDLLRLEAGVRARVLGMLLQLQRDLTLRLATARLTDFSKARVAALVKEAGIAIDVYYVKMQGELADAMGAAAETGAAASLDAVNTSLGVDLAAGLPTETFIERIASNTLIMGAPSSEWWARQSQDTSFRFANTVRQGLLAGDTNEEIVARVAGGRGYPGIMDVSRSNARTLVHTSIQAAANAARNETYQKNSDIIEGVRQVSTLDGHTTDICIAYDGAEYTLDGEPMEGTELPYEGGVPRHWNCRSVEVPITKSFRELGISIDELPEGERATGEGPKDLTFESWLDGRTEEQQDEQLGKGRAELWRDGKITLKQLLDLNGNSLTLEELRRKYEDD